MIEQIDIYLEKALESLAGAESEFVNRRYNNCANRCYYACFQVAISALLRAGIVPRDGHWGHEFVQGEFVGQLINRRKLYPAEFRHTLFRHLNLRHEADYGINLVTQTEAARALRRTRDFVHAVHTSGRGQQ